MDIEVKSPIGGGGVERSCSKGFRRIAPRIFRRSAGLTLVEVLITIGIVAVVAVMVIPNLKKAVDASVYRAQFKKTIAVLNHAGEMAHAIGNTNWGLVTQKCPDDLTKIPTQSLEKGDNNVCAIFNSTLKGVKFLGLTKDLKEKYYPAYSYEFFDNYRSLELHYLIFQMPNGVIIGVNKNFVQSRTTSNPGMLRAGVNGVGANNAAFIDVNGFEKPNVEVVCKSRTMTDPCEVDNGHYMGDIFPILMHDGVVSPLGRASAHVFEKMK